ncbi:hypothetical protein DL768_010514 [Monosporascus sp. mg162]|nr:hypothetical protein DL768_010514 [Monosporascus sp. mg162]
MAASGSRGMGTNRYRDWGELRYSLRSLDRYAAGFINKIQILVNSVTAKPDGTGELRPQRPSWLREDPENDEHVQVLSQEAFFREEERRCLPTFNSLAIESEVYKTPLAIDRLVALSDDMFLGLPHAVSDFYSPLFGSKGWPTFGEKPFVYHTSYLLNHRFGPRARHVQAHFEHSVSRSVMRERWPPSLGPPLEEHATDSAANRIITRFTSARSDTNGDGYFDWMERRMILDVVEPGWQLLSSSDSSEPAKQNADHDRMYYRLPQMLEKADLELPMVNLNVFWTYVDGPETIRNIRCHDFSLDKCFADSFGSPLSDDASQNTDFMASKVFSRLASQHPDCGDCLIKFVLASATRGLEPLLPPKSKPKDRLVVIKALKKYHRTIVGTDAMKFIMIKDADQARMELLDRTVKIGKKYGQYCLNDDVMTCQTQLKTKSVSSALA